MFFTVSSRKGSDSYIHTLTRTAKWQYYCGAFIVDEWFVLPSQELCWFGKVLKQMELEQLVKS